MKAHQESDIEFERRDDAINKEYPVATKIIVHQYGANLEDCVAKAREEFGLGKEWEVVGMKGKQW